MFRNNSVHDNNDTTAPGKGTAELGPGSLSALVTITKYGPMRLGDLAADADELDDDSAEALDTDGAHGAPDSAS